MKVMDIVMWLIFGSLFVAVLRRPQAFASAVTAVGGFTTQESGILSGEAIPPQ